MEDGQLFVVGRIKDTIIINGLKHCAEDIEARAMQIHEVFAGFGGAAFSIDISGHEQAVLVQEIGRIRCTPDQVNEAVGQACASVTREHGLRLFDLVVVRRGSLPRTSSGKIQRARARDIYLADGFKRLNRPLGFSERALAG
jgi:acyl-CoA synthetase (AMP-forming)/AMP-acid ligase II